MLGVRFQLDLICVENANQRISAQCEIHEYSLFLRSNWFSKLKTEIALVGGGGVGGDGGNKLW